MNICKHSEKFVWSTVDFRFDITDDHATVRKWLKPLKDKFQPMGVWMTVHIRAKWDHVAGYDVYPSCRLRVAVHGDAFDTNSRIVDDIKKDLMELLDQHGIHFMSFYSELSSTFEFSS